MGGEEAVTIEKTVQRLNILADTIRETLAEDMSEVPLVAVDQQDLEAIRMASVALQSLRIMTGAFKEEAEQ